ncbi:hypothetical protein LTR62_002767 [Meristemomyces frigidus]|uniref:ASX DEUBAD domain-containing protein n=1 Tax=Meristemomyces frigidus TaxID=1508187 RepID=A0AAN7T7F4_9PEZI|nr:hypothetical protein LTR62_002767 [Meristemomyces frigidus]
MSQQRLLVSEKSKLRNVDLCTVLRKQDAWDTLPLETRQELYNMLPAPSDDVAAHDVDVNPLKTPLRPYIEAALRQFQEDLGEGKESKKWREAGMRASADRKEGLYEGCKEEERERYRGGKKEVDEQDEGEEEEERDTKE